MIDAASPAGVSRIEAEARVLQGLHGGRLIGRAIKSLLRFAIRAVWPGSVPAQPGLRPH